MKTQKDEKIKLLAEALTKANNEAISTQVDNDGGSANLDHVVIRLKGWRINDIIKVNQMATVEISEEPYSGSLWKGCRPINFFNDGQGNRRYKQIQSAYKSLSESCKKIFTEDECFVTVFYQMD